MKLLDPLHDVNVVVDSSDSKIEINVNSPTWIPILYQQAGNRALLVFKDSVKPENLAFSIEYGETSSYPGNPVSGSIYQSTYRKYASQLLDDPEARFTYTVQHGVKGSTTLQSCFFLTFNRSVKLDQIRKQGLLVPILRSQSGSGDPADPVCVYDEREGTPNKSFYRSLNGDYDTLYWSGSNTTSFEQELACGQLWYQPGVVILDAVTPGGTTGPGTVFNVASGSHGTKWISGSSEVGDYFYDSTSGSIPLLTTMEHEQILWGFYDRLYRGGILGYIEFQARKQLFYQDFYCRAYSHESNYSSNPTYLDHKKQIRTSNSLSTKGAHSYITTVGLYDSSENLLAVAKLSRAIRKDVTTERLFRVRLAQ